MGNILRVIYYSDGCHECFQWLAIKFFVCVEGVMNIAVPCNTSNETVGDNAYSGSVYSIGSFNWWYCFLGALSCLIMSGLASGTNIGLMSLSPLSLQLLTDTPNVDKRRDPSLRLQARRAAKVLPLVKRKHLVLVTLLLTTATADEILPLCIDAIAPTWVAVVLSVATMLLFTEVLPTAIFTDQRNNLKLASALAPFVWGLVGLLGIITYPMSKALHCLVEKTHSQVGDGESFAGSLHDEEHKDNNDTHTAHETKQLLRIGRLRALLQLFTKEATRNFQCRHHDSNVVGAGPPAAAETMPREGAAKEPEPQLLELTQAHLLERCVELSSVRMRDVIRPLSRSVLTVEMFRDTVDWPPRLAVWSMAQQPYSAWYVIRGLRGEGVWDCVNVEELVRDSIGSSVSFIDAVVCSAQRNTFLELVTVEESERLLDVVSRLRSMFTVAQHSPKAPPLCEMQSRDVVLITDGSGTIVGTCNTTEALRRLTVPIEHWKPAAGKEQHSSHRRSSAAAAVSLHHDDSDQDDDVEALLMGPRIANAVPWSIKYASRNW